MMCSSPWAGIVAVRSKPAAANRAQYSASVRSRPPRLTSMFTSWDLANDGASPGGISSSMTSSRPSAGAQDRDAALVVPVVQDELHQVGVAALGHGRDEVPADRLAAAGQPRGL